MAVHEAVHEAMCKQQDCGWGCVWTAWLCMRSCVNSKAMQMKQKKVQRENGKNVMEQMVTIMEQGKKIVTHATSQKKKLQDITYKCILMHQN